MARVQARSRSRARGGGSPLWWGIALIGCAVAALSALAMFYVTVPRKPVLQAGDLCPVKGPQGITAVLIDTSDDLLSTTQKEVHTLLNDQITTLPTYYKLDIRVLDIPNVRSRSLFSMCNPGDGAGLSEWTDNPRLARLRWIESFDKPAEEAIKGSLASAKAKSSPIMAAIQDIALDDFSASSVQGIPKSLIVISDMLEFTPYYGQYPSQGDLSYERYRHSPAYLKFRTDLHGARVTIDYVQRPEVKIDPYRHGVFWKDWIDDNRGTIEIIHRLQGG